VKIIGHEPDLHAQGYFVYDSKKSGSMTVSHLRFGPARSARPTSSEADLVACHQFGLLDRFDVLADRRQGGTFLLNARIPPTSCGSTCRRDPGADRRARAACSRSTPPGRSRAEDARAHQHDHAAVLLRAHRRDGPRRAIGAIKESIDKAYGRRGRRIVERNEAAVDGRSPSSPRCPCPDVSSRHRASTRRSTSSIGSRRRRDRLRRAVTMTMIAGKGDLLPGVGDADRRHVPTGTTQVREAQARHRDPGLGAGPVHRLRQVRVVCPHATIRMKAYEPAALEAPDGFLTKKFRSRELDGHQLTIQVAPDDCTGCGICVDVCPAKDKTR
jgi:pyruvate-ferredoxin/flavodoxin oxidoreductase